MQTKGIPDETTAVINVSGQNVLDPLRRWTPGFRQNVISSRVETNQMLANAIRSCTKNPPKVFISISGVSYYPPDSSQVHDENSSGGDYDFLSNLCKNWEDASKVDGKTRNVTVRTGIVLGLNGGIVKSMYLPFYLGLGAKIGSGNQYMPWIHLNDLTNIFIKSIKNDQFDGVINAVAPQIINNSQFTKAMGRAMWRPSMFTIPEKLVLLLFGEERAVMMTQGPKVVSKRLQQLGYELKFKDIDTAFKDILK